MSDVRPFDDFFRDRRVLITGGMGFIGSNLAIRLVELGADVLLVDSMLPAYGATVDNIAPVRDRVQINFSDVRDRHSMAFLVRDRELIFSLAGQVSHSESMRDPQTDLDINCRAQLTLLECCRRSNPDARIVFASTRQLYGRPQYLPVDEAHPRAPVDVNGINKLAADMYYSLYSEVHGIPTVSLRMTNTYGPRMELANNHKGFVGIFIRKALSGDKIQIYGDGAQRRDFNYVDDAVRALLLAAERPGIEGQVFNLGHPEPCSLLEFIETLASVIPLDYEIVPFPPDAKVIDIGDYYGAFDRFHAVSGWAPRVGLRDGLEQTVAWYRANGWS